MYRDKAIMKNPLGFIIKESFYALKNAQAAKLRHSFFTSRPRQRLKRPADIQFPIPLWSQVFATNFFTFFEAKSL